MKIAFACSEIVPFTKTGGLADVAGALSKFLHKRGVDVRPFMPLYKNINLGEYNLIPVEFAQNIPIKMGPLNLSFSLYTVHDSNGLATYFIHCPHLYGRESIYTSDWDEGIRFAFFSRAVIEACQYMGWAPDIFHIHDWHTSLIPIYLKTIYSWDKLFANSKTLLTLHNLGYQGIFSSKMLPYFALDHIANLLYREDLQKGLVNFMKTGILYADYLSTVSPTYAKEIQTPFYGFGLDKLLKARKEKLVGILNGIDYSIWDPVNDPYIPYRYSIKKLTGKKKNKQFLIQNTKLNISLDIPLAGVVSRLTYQKGFDLMFDSIPPLLRNREMGMVVLGTGEKKYEQFFSWLSHTFPEKVAYIGGYSEFLAHLIEAGSDIFIMPSLFEPCGLNQMYSLRYGTLPIVRKTGGLADSVKHIDPNSDSGTGFVFEHFSPHGLSWALNLALDYWKNKKLWRSALKRAMLEDFSWDKQGEKYLKLYRDIIENRSFLRSL